MRPILIVEDEPAIADLIEMTLEPLGQPLIKAHTGNEAANLLESTLFDLILLDVMLPGVDGFTLMDYIAPTGTPVIFLTAKATVEDRVRGLRLGAYDYIVKPFAPPELLARVPASRREALRGVLAQDPRPSYQRDPERIYGMEFAGWEIRFQVRGERLTVVEVKEKG